MEMESNLVEKNQKLEAFGILKKGLAVSGENINFFIFTILTSLPLLFFLVYFELSLQNLLIELSEIAKHPPAYFLGSYYRWRRHDEIADKLNRNFVNELIQLCLLYLVPLHLLELGTVFVTVDLASKIHAGESSMMTLKEMVNKPFDKARLKSTFITSIYVLVLSTCILLGLIWVPTTYFFILRSFEWDVIFAALCFPVFVAMLALYLAFSAVWNVSLVVSMLDGVHGIEALALGIYYSRRSEWRGIFLMLVFFAWGVVLRLPCLYFGCYGRENYFGIVVQVSLFCFGNVLKWVVCMVYFFDCKKRALEKNISDESVCNDIVKTVEVVEEHVDA